MCAHKFLNKNKYILDFRFKKKIMKFWKYGFFIKLGKEKGIESEILYISEWSFFIFNLNWIRKCDHAGLEFILEILGVHFYIKYYDARHWNYQENRWYNDGEEWTESLLAKGTMKINPDAEWEDGES